MKVKICEGKIIVACSAEVIALDDVWCIKLNTAYEINDKPKFFLQLKDISGLTNRELKKKYIDIVNAAYETEKLDCSIYNLEVINVIESEDEEDDINEEDTVLAALILRTEEILTKEFFKCLERCNSLEKENKPLHLLNEIGVLRGLKYALATCNINLDEKTEKRCVKFIKLQEQLKNVGNTPN